MDKKVTLEINNISFNGETDTDGKYVITPVSAEGNFNIPLKMNKCSFMNIGKQIEVYDNSGVSVITPES